MRALIMVVAVGVAAGAAVGPAAAEPPRSLRVAVDGVLPFADWDQTAGPGGGGSIAAMVQVEPELEITARVGVVAHRGVTTAGVTTRVLEAPIVGGARYGVARSGRARGFAFGEVGVRATRTTVAVAGVSDHDSALGFAAAIGGGVAYDRVDLQVAAWLADLGDLDRGVGVTVALGVEVVRW